MSYRIANEQMGMAYRDVWSTAYVNALPDSAFLYVDGDDRRFPVRDKDGNPDAAHIANAMARINQADLPEATRVELMKKAKAMAAAHPGIGSGTTKEYQGTAGSGRSAPPASLLGMQYRSFEMAVVELRSEGDGRTLVGRAVPFGQTVSVDGGRERFMPGAFARQISLAQGGGQGFGAVKIYLSHADRINRDLAAGKTVELREQMDGLHGAWRLFETSKGNDALAHVREGDRLGLSVGFKMTAKGTHKAADGVFEHRDVHLDHIALTDEPAYAGAGVTAIRSASSPGSAGYRTTLLQARSLLDRVLVG